MACQPHGAPRPVRRPSGRGSWSQRADSSRTVATSRPRSRRSARGRGRDRRRLAAPVQGRPVRARCPPVASLGEVDAVLACRRGLRGRPRGECAAAVETLRPPRPARAPACSSALIAAARTRSAYCWPT